MKDYQHTGAYWWQMVAADILSATTGRPFIHGHFQGSGGSGRYFANFFSQIWRSDRLHAGY
jgi:hypothetical protein